MALGGAMFIDRLGRRTLFVSATTNACITLANQTYQGYIQCRNAMRYIESLNDIGLLD
jgi:hypothetical protein